MHRAGELDEAAVERMLKERSIARVVCEADGLRHERTVRYYAVDLPVLYVNALDALCQRLTRADARIRFEVDEVEGPGRWKTVIGWGTLEELDRAAAPASAPLDAAVYRIRLDRLRGFFRGDPGAARAAGRSAPGVRRPSGPPR
jgi:hypothetical protein